MAGVGIQERKLAIADLRSWRFFFCHHADGVDEDGQSERSPHGSEMGSQGADLPVCQLLFVSHSAAKPYVPSAATAERSF